MFSCFLSASIAPAKVSCAWQIDASKSVLTYWFLGPSGHVNLSRAGIKMMPSQGRQRLKENNLCLFRYIIRKSTF